MGHLSVIFIDDSYLQGTDFQLCVKNVKDTIALLDRVGLVIHPVSTIPYSETCISRVHVRFHKNDYQFNP